MCKGPVTRKILTIVGVNVIRVGDKLNGDCSAARAAWIVPRLYDVEISSLGA